MKPTKDLGIKIGTKDEVYWTTVKKMTELQLRELEIKLKEINIDCESLEKAIKLNKGILEYSSDKIKEEKEKI